MDDGSEVIRQTLMRMDEEEIEERLAKNIFSEEAKPIALEVLEHKKNNPVEKVEEPGISIHKRELVTIAAVGLVGYLIFNLRKLSGFRGKRE